MEAATLFTISCVGEFVDEYIMWCLMMKNPIKFVIILSVALLVSLS
jgi:hypothetical protein